MKKLFFFSLCFTLLVSCTSDDDTIVPNEPPCLSEACAYELINTINLDGTGIGNIQPDIKYFMRDKNYPTSISHMKYEIAISLGFQNSEINQVFSSLISDPSLAIEIFYRNREKLNKLREFKDWNDRALFWYKSVNYWIVNENSALSKDFEAFFNTYGHLNRFPYEWNGMSNEDEDFHDDMDDIIEKYPEIFTQNDIYQSYVPERYRAWLFTQRWKNRLGSDTFLELMNTVELFL